MFYTCFNSIEKNNCSTNKNVMINNARYYQCVPLSATYSQPLPKLKDILTKHWHILQANQSYIKTFSELPIIAFRKDTRLK